MFVKRTLLFTLLDFTCKNIFWYFCNHGRKEEEIREQGRCKQAKMTSNIAFKYILSQILNEII